MKKLSNPQILKYFLLFTSILCFSFVSRANDGPVALRKVLLNKKVTLQAISNGGYCGTCLHLKLVNNTQQDLEVLVDPGMIFTPEDSSFQPLIAWGDETIALAANATGELDLKTFCGKYDAHCPAKNIKYTYRKQADTGLLKTLAFTKNKDYRPYLVQTAVWVFTNNRNISTVYDCTNDAGSEQLVRFIARIKKLPLPKYYAQYQHFEVAGKSVIQKDSMKVIVPLSWSSDAEDYMQVTVYDQNGKVYKKIEADRIIDKYGNTVLVQFLPNKDPKGRYTLEARDKHNKIWDHKEVEIDYE